MNHYSNKDVIIVDTRNHIWDYRAIVLSLISEGFMPSLQGIEIKALIEESVRQVFEILSKDFTYFTNQIQGRPILFRMSTGAINPHAKITIEIAWREMALSLYFILLEQLGYANTNYELALVQIYMDGLVLIKDYQYVK